MREIEGISVRFSKLRNFVECRTETFEGTKRAAFLGYIADIEAALTATLSRNKELKERLKPFADIGCAYAHCADDIELTLSTESPEARPRIKFQLHVGDFRQARTAMNGGA